MAKHVLEHDRVTGHCRNMTVGIDVHSSMLMTSMYTILPDNTINSMFYKCGVTEKEMNVLKDLLRTAEKEANRHIDMIILESTGPYSNAVVLL